MIIIKITERKKPAPLPAPFVSHASGVVYPPATQTIYNEVKRRDDLIRKLVAAFPYKVGDKAPCHNEADQKKWGDCTITHICSEYIQLDRDFKWPKNDNPMIITAASADGEIFVATTNYFKA